MEMRGMELGEWGEEVRIGEEWGGVERRGME